VLVELTSADVIHAFWVPQLAGKTQTIPGQTNRQWLQADRPGVYRGQCSQYCGAQHAHMAFEVVAEPPAAFRAWLAAQRQPAPADAAGRNCAAGVCSPNAAPAATRCAAPTRPAMRAPT
jgi:cytochrome c oxidase subunit 2